MGRRWLLLAVILTAPSGCDNVSWGGVDVRLQAPPAPVEPAAAGEAEAEAEAPLPPLPEGPILLAGTREGDTVALTVVGEVVGDALRPLPAEDEAPGFLDHFSGSLLPAGTELILFSEGVRVGRATVAETGQDDRGCVVRPRVRGILELVPDASGARRFLALTKDAGAGRSFGDYRTLDHDYDQRVASLALAQEAIPVVGAEWPPSLLESRADIQVFRLPEAQGPSVAATFLLSDRLAVSPPGEGAWSLFVIGTARGGSYGSSYIGFRPVASEGKGAPRYFDHLDWDGDGDSEILLEVLGAGNRWWSALGQRGAGWTQTYQDPCGTLQG